MIDHATRIRTAVKQLIAEGEPFLADQVHERLPRSTRRWLDSRPAFLGGVMRHFALSGQARHVGWADSPRRHGYPSRIWQPGGAE